jgi:dipeptidyl aminopeptidase/acylaminoacyl peptidase
VSARELGVAEHQVIKTLVMEDERGAPLLVLMHGDREQALEVAWQSSPVSSVATWKSPVLLIHADQDRNVNFSQTVDLVQRLAAAGVRHEELVIPDDTHHWMRHANAVRVHEAVAVFFERELSRRP